MKSPAKGVYVFNDIITPGVAIGTAANPDLKWETTRQLNLGVDLQLFNLFDVSANYFIKNTNDLLFSPDVSAIIGSYGPGGYPPIINAGDVSNKGFEFEFAYATDSKKNIGMNFGSVLGFNLFGLDISANLYASLGHKIVRNYERQQPYANQLDYVLDRWTVDNPSNEVPVVTTSINRNGVFSDFYVEDGSFLRLRNVQFGYNLPSSILEK
mgnify:CR=1 FL=1